MSKHKDRYVKRKVVIEAEFTVDEANFGPADKVDLKDVLIEQLGIRDHGDILCGVTAVISVKPDGTWEELYPGEDEEDA